MINLSQAKNAANKATARLRGIGPAWWSAVAGGAVAGAVLAPSSRVSAGLFVGGVVLAIALWQEHSESCCDDCAAGTPCGAGVTAAHIERAEPMADSEINGPAGFSFEGGGASCG